MFIVRFLIGNGCAALLFGLILLLKRLAGSRMPPRFHYHVWFVLLLSLGIAGLPASVFPAAEGEAVARAFTASPAPETGELLSVPDAAQDWRDDYAALRASTDPTPLQRLLVCLWCAGGLCVAGAYLAGGGKLRRLRRVAVPLPETCSALCAACCARAGVRRRVTWLCADGLSSPMTFGLARPCVILPRDVAERASPQALEHILLHELTHIRHCDTGLNALFCAGVAVCWFNPLFWFAYANMRRDREAYCDWTVLNGCASAEERLRYGETLLQFAARENRVSAHAAVGLLARRSQLRYRIERIAAFQSETRRTRRVGCGVVALALLCALAQVPVLAACASDFGMTYRPAAELTLIERDWDALFGDTVGCAVVYDRNADAYFVSDPALAARRLAPCSTCKIYSALNALEQGVITPTDNLLKWDALPRELSVWNADQDLASAMRNSANWYFQRLDQTVGAAELEAFYQRIGYGNASLEGDALYYWNGGRLRISPLEQVALMAEFQDNAFGFADANVQAVKNAIFVGARGGAELYGKTGTGRIGTDDVLGWFVGYLETPENVYSFAVCVQAEHGANGAAAAEIAEAVLESFSDENFVLPEILHL